MASTAVLEKPSPTMIVALINNQVPMRFSFMTLPFPQRSSDKDLVSSTRATNVATRGLESMRLVSGSWLSALMAAANNFG
jgi:hypothetical protein